MLEVKVHNVVRIKSGAHRGLVGVVEEVVGASVTVRIEGVRDGVGFSKVAVIRADACEVRS